MIGHALLVALILAAPDAPLAAEATAPARAKQGMVATSHPAAVEAGLEVLKAGGNAIDAAIAANVAIAVVEPMSCGLGGDLFAIVWDAKTKKLYGLNASGRAPKLATLAAFKEKGIAKIPIRGPLSWSVPGCVDGWDELRKRFGTRPWDALLAPAIKCAKDGFVVTPLIGRGWRSTRAQLAADENAKVAFLRPDGSAPAIGSMMTNAPLAATLEAIAKGGRDAFYTGDLAAEIVRNSEAVGGLIRAEDLASHRSEWVEPISTDYRGHTVWQLPPNGQGLAVLQMLNLLEGFDVKKSGLNSPEFLHWFVEAKKLAYADRAAYYADPEFAKGIPIGKLASKEYAKARRALIDPEHAAKEVPPGDIGYAHADTIYLTVVDKDRNCVSLIQSNYFGWGSGVAAGKLGFMMQNRGNLFSLDPKHPNRLEPGKRPFHTIIPGFVTKDGAPLLSYGVMGGDMQPQGQVQVLLNMLDHGMDPQAAGRAARIRHEGSATPIGDVMTDGGEVFVERSMPESAAESLTAKGHRVVRKNDGNYGGYQAIWINAATGELLGGSDPRKDGLAKGY
ncbi:MAG TPA: gamma-glutamyltransferase [Planctomycetia bacterium]|nr:gamma-glutamyltransferase [Planctomycetia bacterium]